MIVITPYTSEEQLKILLARSQSTSLDLIVEFGDGVGGDLRVVVMMLSEFTLYYPRCRSFKLIIYDTAHLDSVLPLDFDFSSLQSITVQWRSEGTPHVPCLILVPSKCPVNNTAGRKVLMASHRRGFVPVLIPSLNM